MGKTFQQWLEEIDDILAIRIGLSHNDLDDWTYYDAWSDGMSPNEAAQEVLENDELFSAGEW